MSITGKQETTAVSQVGISRHGSNILTYQKLYSNEQKLVHDLKKAGNCFDKCGI